MVAVLWGLYRQFVWLWWTALALLPSPYMVSLAPSGPPLSSVFLQKSFWDLCKVVQGCTIITRPKALSVTSYVQILTRNHSRVSHAYYVVFVSFKVH